MVVDEGGSTKSVLSRVGAGPSPMARLRSDVFPVPGYPCASILMIRMVTVTLIDSMTVLRSTGSELNFVIALRKRENIKVSAWH